MCDIRRLPFADHSIDEILALAMLEHFQNPYEVLDEFQRMIRPDAFVSIHVPSLGTYAAQLDLDHKFLAVLRMWDDSLKRYYERAKPTRAYAPWWIEARLDRPAR